MISQLPFYPQLGEFDCGVTCLKMITEYYGKSISFRLLNHQLPIQEEGVSLKDISDVATKQGLNTKGVKVTFEQFVQEISTPCIAFWKQQHFVVIYHVNDEYVWIADPAMRGIYIQSKETFKAGWICDYANQAGVLLLFETTPAFFGLKKSREFEYESLNTL